MEKKKAFLFGFWMMLSVTIARIGLFIYAVIVTNNLSARYQATLKNEMFIPLLIIAILIVETLFYWWRRYFIFRSWALIHIWTVFITMIFFVVLKALLFITIAKVMVADTYYNTMRVADKIIVYLTWILIIVGHIFFIATIVKSFRQKETAQNDQPSGLLDEFTD